MLRLNFTQTCFYLLAQDMGTIVGAAEQWRPYHTAQSGSPKTWAQFVIELDYSYRYLLEVCSELSDICFLIWLRYHSMLALHDHPVLAMVNISTLELYQLLQYLYVCSSVMSVHLEGGGSAWDASRVSLTSVDMVSRLAKCCWMSTIPMVCRDSRRVVTALFEP